MTPADSLSLKKDKGERREGCALSDTVLRTTFQSPR
jgi:hypothetical protein